jgi:hypothetical protein
MVRLRDIVIDCRHPASLGPPRTGCTWIWSRPRLLSLGASVLERHPEWLVLTEPEGNEFCLFNS